MSNDRKPYSWLLNVAFAVCLIIIGAIANAMQSSSISLTTASIIAAVKGQSGELQPNCVTFGTSSSVASDQTMDFLQTLKPKTQIDPGAGPERLNHQLVCRSGGDVVVLIEREVARDQHIHNGSLFAVFVNPQTHKVSKTLEYYGNPWGSPPKWDITAESGRLKLKLETGYAWQGVCYSNTKVVDLRSGQKVMETIDVQCE